MVSFSKTIVSWIAVAAVIFSLFSAVEADGKCLGCTLATGLIYQMADTRGKSISAAVNELCTSIIPDPGLSSLCTLVFGVITPTLQAEYDKGSTPDASCIHALKFCPANTPCKLFNTWPLTESVTSSSYTPVPISPSLKLIMEKDLSEQQTYRDIAGEVFDLLSVGLGTKRPNLKLDLIRLGGQARALALAYGLGVSEKESLENTRFGSDLSPKVDQDGDSHSGEFGARGSHWRGRDCDDTNGSIYPGRKTNSFGPEVDHNCNGISGVDETTGKSWEDKLCSGTKQYGFLALGDSATAHFGIPGEYVTASAIRPGLFEHAMTLIQNEGDWPQCSGYTGFEKDPKMCKENKHGFFSIYDAMRSRNLCMHRDYANVAVNGNRIIEQLPLNSYIQRKKDDDHPVIVTLNLIGNDVCSDSAELSSMTTAAQFQRHTEAVLRNLDNELPSGSHIFISGLVDGDILYDILHQRKHPVGPTYPEVYDFLNCHETSPCAGWMNRDRDVRQRTTTHARMLTSLITPTLATLQPSLKNIRVHFLPLADILTNLFRQWFIEGKNSADLIEPLDGFHPSTTGLALLMQGAFDEMLKNVDIPINPNNNEIAQRFGDQGGY